MDAGWFPDPQDPASLRYWDGATWTAHTQPVAPATPPAPAAPAAPAWGMAPRAAAPAWGTPASAAPPIHGHAPVPPSASPKRRFPVVGLIMVIAILAGAFVAIYFVTSKDDSAAKTVATEKVVAVFTAKGVTCDQPTPNRAPGDVADDATIQIPARLQTDTGQISQGQMADLMNTVTALDEFARKLPAGSTYAWMRCGGSWLLINQTSTLAIAIGPESEALAPAIEKLGVSPVYQLPTGI